MCDFSVRRIPPSTVSVSLSFSLSFSLSLSIYLSLSFSLSLSIYLSLYRSIPPPLFSNFYPCARLCAYDSHSSHFASCCLYQFLSTSFIFSVSWSLSISVCLADSLFQFPPFLYIHVITFVDFFTCLSQSFPTSLSLHLCLSFCLSDSASLRDPISLSLALSLYASHLFLSLQVSNFFLNSHNHSLSPLSLQANKQRHLWRLRGKDRGL